MCFRCHFCGDPSRPREKANMVLLETHEVVQRNGNITREVKTEVKACAECYVSNAVEELWATKQRPGLVRSVKLDKDPLEGLYEEDE